MRNNVLNKLVLVPVSKCVNAKINLKPDFVRDSKDQSKSMLEFEDCHRVTDSTQLTETFKTLCQ